MAEFLKHIACPRCGSSDAFATYSDGGKHCFSCGFHPRGISPYITAYDNSKRQNEEVEEVSLALPDHFTTTYPEAGVRWGALYGISVGQLLSAGVLGSIKTNQLCFPFYEQTNRFGFRQTSTGTKQLLSGYQCRNFNTTYVGKDGKTHNQPKYVSKGNLRECYPIYSKPVVRGQLLQGSPLLNKTLVLTEDCLSAIKISSLQPAMPCLTSTLSLSKINSLAGRFDAFLVWLDGDMYHKAQEIALRFQFLGKRAKAAYTELDPKCYEDEQISQVLLTGRLQ